jgi:hypothetical protein
MAGDRRRAAASMAHAYDHSLCIRLNFLPQFLVVIKVGAGLAFDYPFRFGIFFGKYFLNFFEELVRERIHYIHDLLFRLLGACSKKAGKETNAYCQATDALFHNLLSFE